VAIPFRMTNDRHTKRAIGIVRKVEEIPTIQCSNRLRLTFGLLDMVIGYGREGLYQSAIANISRFIHGWHNSGGRIIYILLRGDRLTEINQRKTSFTDDRQGG